MRIRELIEREPFGNILQCTLADHFSTRFARDYQVRWLPGRPSLKTDYDNLERYWLCNYYLNIIYSPLARPEVFAPPKREYSQSPSRWKAPFQKTYVELACNSHFIGRFLAQAAVEITPTLPDAMGIVIMGGNHKIRILDYKQNIAYGILKQGFNSGFMTSDIQTRQLALAAGVPTPRFKQIDPNNRWYIEEYIVGTPINRITDRMLANHVLFTASNVIRKFSERYLRTVQLTEYTAELAASIRTLLTQNPHFHYCKKTVLEFLDTTLRILRRTCSQNTTLFTSLTHGDFQPANILLDDARKVWIIDWEYADRRIACYDNLTYELAVRRRKAGLANRMRNFVEHGFQTVGLHWDPQTCATAQERWIHILVFVLEEMLHILTENNNPLFRESFVRNHTVTDFLDECCQLVTSTTGNI